MLLCVGAGIALTGCGGGGSTNHGSPGTPSGSYTLTITAAQGTTYQATQPLTLVVQ
jgi:ABC-type Fe3+-hydroxamate transport system substrate-binding protein